MLSLFVFALAQDDELVTITETHQIKTHWTKLADAVPPVAVHDRMPHVHVHDTAMPPPQVGFYFAFRSFQQRWLRFPAAVRVAGVV